VQWQRRLGPALYGDQRRWIDYAPEYNILLEAALVEGLQHVVLKAPRDQAAEGDWHCNLETLVQLNISNGVETVMRRVLVTHYHPPPLPVGWGWMDGRLVAMQVSDTATK
jgi:hypothetical protein